MAVFSTQFILAVLMKWIITSHRAVVQVGTGWSFVHQFFLFKQPLSADLMDDLPSHRCLSFLWFWIRSDHSWCFYCNILHDFCWYELPTILTSWPLWTHKAATCFLQHPEPHHLTQGRCWDLSVVFFTWLRSWLVTVLREILLKTTLTEWTQPSPVSVKVPDCAAPNLNWKPGGNPELLLALPGIQWEEVCKVVHTK